MLLSHAVLLTEARSYLAALADTAHSFDGSLEYERVLLQLDALHNGTVPAATVVPVNDPTVLFDIAQAAISDLREHGVDELELEICLAMLQAAHDLDVSS